MLLQILAPVGGQVQASPTFQFIYKETSYMVLLKHKLTHMLSQCTVALLSHVR